MQHTKGALLCWLLLLVAWSEQGPLDQANSCPSTCLCKNLGSSSESVEVDCQLKNLTSVPGSLSPKIRILKLSGNHLTYLPAEGFAVTDLAILKNLRLRFNNIATVHKDAFKNLKRLEVLMLDYNRISSLDADTFRHNSKLEIVSLSHNLIERLEDGLFANLPELASVEVENCQISYIGPKAFANVPNLSFLYLSGNQLVHVDFAALFPLNRLRMILDKNPWKCDCKLKSLRDWMVKGLDFKIEWYQDHAPLCAQPPKLANKTWPQIKSEEFVCST